jgi:hypothetical protein
MKTNQEITGNLNLKRYKDMPKKIKSKNTELIGISFINGKTVVVSRATRQKDHGKSFWLCLSTIPPSAIYFSALTKKEACYWMHNEAESEEVLECSKITGI